MRHHIKYGEVETLIDADIPILLTGEKGSGKTTLIKQVADKLGFKFYSMSMTRQTTLSHLIGFMSVNGTYIPSQLREAIENGGLFLLDEIDAADANVLLSLNTIENGYMSFPTGIIECHKDFRLAATANPQDQHDFYTGRSKLDAASLDRFDIVEIPRDPDLEKSLVDSDTFRKIDTLRKVLVENNSSVSVSMRDSMRYQKRKGLNLLSGFIERMVEHSELILEKYEEMLKTIPKHSDQLQCATFDELLDLVNIQSGVPKAPPQPDYQDD